MGEPLPVLPLSLIFMLCHARRRIKKKESQPSWKKERASSREDKILNYSVLCVLFLVLVLNFGCASADKNLSVDWNTEKLDLDILWISSHTFDLKTRGEGTASLEKDFENKKVAIFLSSGEGGEPDKHEQAITKYIKNVLAKYPHVKPVAIEAFGGRMKIMGKTVTDNYKAEKVKTWAEELGKKLAG